MYAAAPWAAHSGNKALFVAFFCIILSMYGGGFATVPAYLADIFGTQFVGAIHGQKPQIVWSALDSAVSDAARSQRKSRLGGRLNPIQIATGHAAMAAAFKPERVGESSTR